MPRRDSTITQGRIDELNKVRGWISPVFVREDPFGGEPHWLITQEDGERIAQGYACGKPGCGAVYDMVMPRCVVCGSEIALGAIAPMREEWVGHLSDRANLPEGRPVDTETFLREVMNDPNIEHRKL